MCGICGYALTSQELLSCEFIEKLCKPLVSRGPDAEGIYIGPGVGLGHRRLKVIDLVTGAQPMHDVSKRYHIVFNGEIYNYKVIRAQLEGVGYNFATKSDTEVLLYTLIHFGLEGLQFLNGMFAFALWDKETNTLLLARDRLGVKPLYWALTNNNLFFASELTSIANMGFAREINNASLGLYLGLSYIPGSNSIIEGVNRLEPASYIKYTHGSITYGKWWSLKDSWASAPQHSKSDIVPSFQALFDDAVAVRLESDVPLGVFLSGGVDSASIVSSIKQRHAELSTFTMAFADKSYNEGFVASQTAHYFDTNHHEEIADASSASLLVEIVRRLDEPFADTSILPTYALCKMARNHVTVALSGDGGDELLAGYETLYADMLYPYVQKIPKKIFKLIQLLVGFVPDSRKKVSAVYKLKQFLAAYPKNTCDAHAWWRMLFTGEQLALILQNDSSSCVETLFLPFRKAWNESEGLVLLDRLLFVDYSTWLADDILYKTDRASMAHGLEVRSPFLDYRLINFCASLSPEYKRVYGKGKILLRKMMEARLPLNILSLPKKGFNAPVSLWLTHQWREMAEWAFLPSTLHKVGLQHECIVRMWKEHCCGKKDHGFRLFTVLFYVLWRTHSKVFV